MSNIRLDQIFNLIKEETENSGTKSPLKLIGLDTICTKLDLNKHEAGLLLTKLVDDKLIFLADSFGLETIGNFYYLNPVSSNFEGYVALEEKSQQEKELLTKKTWYESENAKQQFEDYPRTKKLATIACVVSILVLLLEILKWILELNETK